MTFDPTKPVRTRDGKPARIICTDYLPEDGDKWIIALVEDDGPERIIIYEENGMFVGPKEHGHDLINIPERKECWGVLYSRNGEFNHTRLASSKEAAEGHITVKIADSVYLKYSPLVVLGFNHYVFEGDKLISHNFEEIAE